MHFFYKKIPFSERSSLVLDLWQALAAAYNAFGTGFTLFVLFEQRRAPAWKICLDLACYGIRRFHSF